MDRRLSDDALRATATEFLVVQGKRDQSNPVASARRFTANFRKSGRKNVTYWEFSDYDHTMVDQKGQSHLTEVLSRISDWLIKILAR